MHNFLFGTEASMREKRMLSKTTGGADTPKPEISSAPSVPSAPENELQLLIGKLDLQQKGELRNKIEEFLANDGQVIGDEITSFNNAVREQISKFPQIRESKTLAQIDALMTQLPNNYDNLITYAMNAGLLTQAELANIAFRAGQRNASPGTPERVEGRIATDILERRIEDAKDRMESFEATRVSMLNDFHNTMYSIPRNQRAAHYRRVTSAIRNIRNANGNPVADYWKARKQWEAASGKSYVRHLREKRGDAMARGPETEAESYNYKIVDRGTGKTIATYKQWTGNYIGGRMSRDEAIRIIESSDPSSVSVSGRNAIIEIDGSHYIDTEKSSGGIIANAPTEKERARRWSRGVDPLSKASLDTQRVAARMGIDTRESSVGENISFQTNVLGAAAAGRLEYMNPSGTYAVLNMRQPAGRNTVGRRYPTQISHVQPVEYTLVPQGSIAQPRLTPSQLFAAPYKNPARVNEVLFAFREKPEVRSFISTLRPGASESEIALLVAENFSSLSKTDKLNLASVLRYICADAQTIGLTIEESFAKSYHFSPVYRDILGKMLSSASVIKPSVQPTEVNVAAPKARTAPAEAVDVARLRTVLPGSPEIVTFLSGITKDISLNDLLKKVLQTFNGMNEIVEQYPIGNVLWDYVELAKNTGTNFSELIADRIQRGSLNDIINVMNTYFEKKKKAVKSAANTATDQKEITPDITDLLSALNIASDIPERVRIAEEILKTGITVPADKRAKIRASLQNDLTHATNIGEEMKEKIATLILRFWTEAEFKEHLESNVTKTPTPARMPITPASSANTEIKISAIPAEFDKFPVVKKLLQEADVLLEKLKNYPLYKKAKEVRDFNAKKEWTDSEVAIGVIRNNLEDLISQMKKYLADNEKNPAPASALEKDLDAFDAGPPPTKANPASSKPSLESELDKLDAHPQKPASKKSLEEELDKIDPEFKPKSLEEKLDDLG